MRVAARAARCMPCAVFGDNEGVISELVDLLARVFQVGDDGVLHPLLAPFIGEGEEGCLVRVSGGEDVPVGFLQGGARIGDAEAGGHGDVYDTARFDAEARRPCES